MLHCSLPSPCCYRFLSLTYPLTIFTPFASIFHINPGKRNACAGNHGMVSFADGDIFLVRVYALLRGYINDVGCICEWVDLAGYIASSVIEWFSIAHAYSS